jgi:Penicillin-insensitive murein endopeptidase
VVLRALSALVWVLAMAFAPGCAHAPTLDAQAPHHPGADRFGFVPASGWYTTSTGLHPASPQTAAVTASTIPIEEPVVGELPFETLKRLPKSGAIVWVGAYARPPWGHFPAGSLPPQLADADVRQGWEGQPNPDIPEYLILRYVNGFNLETRVYFGTQHPSDEQLSRAQDELDRLELPNNAAPRPRPRIHWRRSLSLGRPDHGSLFRGVRFPAAGPTFFTWDPILLRSPDRRWRRWGNDRLVRIVLRVLAAYARDDPNAPRIGIGDFSRPHGGYFGPKHASHQNGLDVDVYYPRLDRRERAPTRPEQIDRRLAQDLLDRFLRAGAVRIFVGPHTHLTGPPGIVQVLGFHDNHMHVRIAAP